MRLFSHLITWILFLYSFFPISSSSSNHLCLEDQSSSLLQFKQSLSINHSATVDPSGYPKVRSWKPDTDCCSWDGVTCHRDTGHVIRLELYSSLLYGPIDSKSSLFHLHDLQVLNLADNHFKHSQIPAAFDRLTNLTYLNLSYSVFSGQIPLQISKLVKLVSLDLSRNEELKLENPNLRILTQNLSNLRELRLDELNMSAEVNSDWCKALSFAHPDLRVLSLSGCSLSGPMDISLLNFRFLSELSLSFNNFSSVVPDFLGNITSLIFLDLSYCEFYGKLPRNIFQLPNLQALSINSNPIDTLPEFPQDSVLQNLDISDSNSSGKLPNSIGNLKFLKKLNLNNCNFSGLIPASLSNLTQLLELDFSGNNFEGVINLSLFFPSSLQKLDLSSNNFAGLFPSSPSNLTQLVELDLSSNNFSGLIPYSLTNFTQLNGLYLGSNNFDGTIYSSLFFHPTLQILDLSENRLTTIVEDFDNANSSHFSSLMVLYLYENQLNRTIPKSIFHLTSLVRLDLSFNDFNDSLDFNMLKSLKNLTNLDLSFNAFSLSNNSGRNFSWPQLYAFYSSSCDYQEFPFFLRNQNHLQFLDLSDNRINGKIPKWIWKPSMRILYLSNNSISGLELPVPDLETNYDTIDLHSNKIQEEIPFEDSNIEVVSNILRNLSSYLNKTTFFSISSTKLTGKIPYSICNASNIQFLDLSKNQLSGQIPKCLRKLVRSLYTLNLGENKFHGTIPHIFRKGCNLRWLNVNNNQLEGRIPRSLAKCKWLEVLDLRNNQICDGFPFWLESLHKLQVLVLRSNKFFGPIGSPKASHSFPMLHVIDLSFNNFIGSLPSKYFHCGRR